MFQIPVTMSTPKAVQATWLNRRAAAARASEPNRRKTGTSAARTSWPPTQIVAASTCRNSRMVSQLTASIPPSSQPCEGPGCEGSLALAPGPGPELFLPGGFGLGSGLLLRGGPGGALLVPAPPDEPVHRDPPRDVAQARDERDEQQQQGGRAGHVDGDQVDVVGVTPALNVVPHLEEPQP